jgi:Cu/Ag efflux protein CusF
MIAAGGASLGTSPIQADRSRRERKAQGTGTATTSAVAISGPTPGTARLFEGIGDGAAVDPRKNRLVLTHGEIEGFMAAMVEMSFMVTPATLLKGIEPGDKVRFTIDADKRAIVDVVPLDR